MNPISNQQFSYDAEKFVYQPDIRMLPPQQPPLKQFKIKSPEKSKKTKKELEKQKKGPFFDLSDKNQ